jgi:hypothetical protein
MNSVKNRLTFCSLDPGHLFPELRLSSSVAEIKPRQIYGPTVIEPILALSSSPKKKWWQAAYYILMKATARVSLADSEPSFTNYPPSDSNKT